jgi:deazaflavin-dependent oxidoreductase (nitroreductase family)
MVRQVAKPTPPKGIRRLLFRAPILLYRLHLGWVLGHRFVLLTHTGRVSGQRRQVVLEVVEYDSAEDTLYVASGFGARAQWYRNIQARPRVTVQIGQRSTPAVATPLPPTQSGTALVEYMRRHRYLARRLMRFCGYEVDGSDEDYFAVGRDGIPIVAVTMAASPE